MPISDEDVVQLREYRAGGMKLKALAKKYGVSVSTACTIARGQVYKDAGGSITKRVVRTDDQQAEYRSWRAMISRCYNSDNKNFFRYRGRTPPVTVHQEWRDSFDAFLAYMGPRPSKCNGGIDRWPDNNGNYEPGNVRWSTQKEQMRNRRDNVFVMYQGKECCITDLVELAVVSKQTLYTRILTMGWDVERALTMPADPRFGKRPSRGPRKPQVVLTLP